MIRPRRDGWQVIVYTGIDPVTGRQRQISRQVKGSRKRAEREETRLKAEVLAGRHRGTAAKTLGEMVDVFLEWREQNGKPIGPRTIQGYRALALAARCGWVPYNAAALVRPPAPRSAKRAMPTKAQARAALQAAKRVDPELYLFLRFEAHDRSAAG